MSDLATNHEDLSGQQQDEPQSVAERWLGRFLDLHTWAMPVVAVIAAILLAMYARAATGRPIDFGAYYGAALDLRAGQSPYQNALAWKAAGHATGSPDPPPTSSISYVYPPALALAILPLTALSLQAASVTWLAILFGCVLGTA